ncbi:ribosomal protein L7/L12 C-terminal domain-containing protein [Helicostylum pulchrum]|nr:ribosomal protein L7/L12 C-terminal domain-containing protein [Helicostylum pulchrum]
MLRFSSKLMTSASVAARQSVRMSVAAPTMCAKRFMSADVLPTPGSGATADPKIAAIVDQIEGLTLLQTSELVAQLKTRLNIQDIAMPMAMPAGGAAPAAAAEEDKPVEKTEFNVKIDKVDAASKAKVIREVKNLCGLNLVEAKKFVESVPKVLKESVTKEEAEKLKKALEALGATVILE